MPINFNGSTDGIEYNVGTDFDNWTALTVGGWVTTDTTSSNRNIITHWDYPNDKSFTLHRSSSSAAWRVEIAYDDTNNTDSLAMDFNPTVGVWYFVVARWTTSRIDLDYWRPDNGNSGNYNTSISRSSISDTAAVLAIGTQAGGGNWFNGRIGPCGVWDVALSDDELRALGKGQSIGRIRPQNLKFWATLHNTPDINDRTGRYTGVEVGTLAETGQTGPPVGPPFGFDFGMNPILVAGAAPIGRTTKNTDAYPLGVNVGISHRIHRL